MGVTIERTASRVALAAAAWCAGGSQAFAHASDRGHVLLLPTGHYLLGGAVAVAASFLVLALAPPGLPSQVARGRLLLAKLRFDGRSATSLAAFALLVILVAAGLWGSRDPLSNPLPLTVWTLWWIGLTLAHGIFGNLWRWINPWWGPYRLLAGERPGSGAAAKDASVLAGLGYLPAIAQFFAFAWFELVHPAPDDPFRLAVAVSAYWLINFAAMLVFGYEAWTARGECFSVFFRMISRLAAFERDRGTGALRLCWPGARLRGVAPLPPTGVAFLLLALGSVSFDGLSRTFAWLALIGVNPLEFPGRSAVILPNTAGLAAVPMLLAAAFFGAVWAGERLSQSRRTITEAAGLLVWSIVPIALAYHLSHYLIALLVNGQYALAAISDPFSRGWDLFGTANNYIEAGLVMGSSAAWTLWNIQAAAIVAGHVLAVLIAHGFAARLHQERRAAALSQLPLTLLMIGYTVFGLWLLSTPTGV